MESRYSNKRSKDQVIDMYHMMYYITQLVVRIHRSMNPSTHANTPGLWQPTAWEQTAWEQTALTMLYITDKNAYKNVISWYDSQTNSSTHKVIYLICQHQNCLECEASGAKVEEVLETGSQQVHYKNVVVLLCTIPSVCVVKRGMSGEILCLLHIQVL